MRAKPGGIVIVDGENPTARPTRFSIGGEGLGTGFATGEKTPKSGFIATGEVTAEIGDGLSSSGAATPKGRDRLRLPGNSHHGD